MDTKDAGKIGGQITLKRHGKDKMKEWGKLGGRPKADVMKKKCLITSCYGKDCLQHCPCDCHTKMIEELDLSPLNYKGREENYIEDMFYKIEHKTNEIIKKLNNKTGGVGN